MQFGNFARRIFKLQNCVRARLVHDTLDLRHNFQVRVIQFVMNYTVVCGGARTYKTVRFQKKLKCVKSRRGELIVAFARTDYLVTDYLETKNPTGLFARAFK